MSENGSNKNKFKKIFGQKAIILGLTFIFCALLLQWSYIYYEQNTLKFPWGTQVYVVSAEELPLLPNEQANYLGTRANEDDQVEFLYHANSMYLRAAAPFSIRCGPGIYYQSIGRMFYGRDVHVIATCDDNDWYLIDFYGEEAYVHSACLFDKLPDLRGGTDEVHTQGSRSEYDLDVWVDEAEPSEGAEQTDATEAQSESSDPSDPTETLAPTNTPAPTATPTPVPTQAPSSAPSDPVMLELFNLVNNARAAEGLAPLSWNSTLAADAAIRAQEIVANFSHTRPDGSQWWTLDPDRMYGENLASGQSTAQEVFNSWMASSGHRANILGAYTSCGFALYYGGDAGSTYYWAQEFGY